MSEEVNFVLVDSPYQAWVQKVEEAQLRLGLPPKPPFRSPCNHCGLCCLISLCPAAEKLYPGVRNGPCPQLVMESEPGSPIRKGKCGLVLSEQRKFGTNRIAEGLGVGYGCSMGDQFTTHAEMEEFDNEVAKDQRARGLDVKDGTRFREWP